MAPPVALLLAPLLGTCLADFTNPFKDLVEGGKFEVTWDEVPDESLPAYISGRVFNKTDDGVTSFQENISSEWPSVPDTLWLLTAEIECHGRVPLHAVRKRPGHLLSLAPVRRRDGKRPSR